MRDIPQHNKRKLRANIKTFPLKSGTRIGCLLSPYLFNIELAVLARSVRQLKTRRGWKGKSHHIFICRGYDRYISEPKDSTSKLLDLTNSFRKVVSYRINSQRSTAGTSCNQMTKGLRKKSGKQHPSQ